MARDREGQLLDGRYLIEGPAEDGYAATDLRDGKRVHIAFVPRDAVAGARRARELVGAHVVKVIDVGDTPEGAAWIAREHLSNTSLRRHLARKGPLSKQDAIEVALGVCDAVAEANGHGLTHGAIDASNVYLAWSASGLVDVQLAGVGALPAVPRDAEAATPSAYAPGTASPHHDVRAIAKLIETMLGGRVPADLRAILARCTSPHALGAPNPLRAIDLAEALAPLAIDPDFAGDRVAARRLRSAMSSTVIADGAYPQSAYPTPQVPHAELAPAVRDVPRSTPPRPDLRPRPRRSSQKHGISRDLPTVIAPRPAFSRRRAVRIVGIVTAAISVALLVLIGTEGARVAHTARGAVEHPVGAIAVAAEPTPPTLPPPVSPAAAPAPVASSPVAPPATIESSAPSATPIPVARPSDLPPAKPAKKRR